MIRDEFLKKQDKDLSTKDLVGVRTMGERAYYINTLNKTNSLIKNLNFTTISMTVIAVILTILLVYIAVEFKGLNSGYAIFGLIFNIILWVWLIVWLVIVKPYLNKKKQKFDAYMKELTDREMNKQKSILNKLNNN